MSSKKLRFNPQIGASVTLHSNLGKSIGVITEIEETDTAEIYTGWLHKDEGQFEIIKKGDTLAGSIYWSVRILRDKAFNASYIEKVEL